MLVRLTSRCALRRLSMAGTRSWAFSITPPTVAVYHAGPRPCSGTQVNRDGWVLTAAHCVTTDKSVDGPLKPIGNFRATPPRTPAPGLQPPANAVAASGTIQRPGGLNIALILFPGLASSAFVSYQRQSGTFDFAHPSEHIFSYANFGAWGYGRYATGNDGPTFSDEISWNSGAGVLRWGWLRVVSYTSPFYRIDDPSMTQITWKGDSGGPLVANRASDKSLNGNTMVVPAQISVHATSAGGLYGQFLADDVAIWNIIPFLNDKLGWFFIKSLSNWDVNNGYLDVRNGSSADGTPAQVHSLADWSAQHWQYHPSTLEIKNENGKCLDVQWNNSADRTPVWMWTCNGGPAQKWSWTKRQELVNANGKCLSVDNLLNTSPLMITTCGSNPNAWLQRWTISASP